MVAWAAPMVVAEAAARWAAVAWAAVERAAVAQVVAAMAAVAKEEWERRGWVLGSCTLCSSTPTCLPTRCPRG